MHIARVILVAVCMALSSAKESCFKECAPNRCGIYLEENNLLELSGIYLASSREKHTIIELKCATHSLPRPAIINWHFRPSGSETSRPLFCASLSTNEQCRSTADEEHRVDSSCLVKLEHINQSGKYYCTADNSVEGSSAKLYPIPMQPRSPEADIQVYGVQQISVISSSMYIGRVGYIQTEVCANPKPNVIWTHHSSDTALTDGQSQGEYALLPIQGAVEQTMLMTNYSKPSVPKQYCYTSQLIIARVSSDADADWSLTVSNGIKTVNQHLSRQLRVYTLNSASMPSVTLTLLLLVAMITRLGSQIVL